MAVDYQFSTNLVPLVAASAFVPLITPWLLLSPPAGYGRSALHIMPRYISSIVRDSLALALRWSRSHPSLAPSLRDFFAPLVGRVFGIETLPVPGILYRYREETLLLRRTFTFSIVSSGNTVSIG